MREDLSETDKNAEKGKGREGMGREGENENDSEILPLFNFEGGGKRWKNF